MSSTGGSARKSRRSAATTAASSSPPTEFPTTTTTMNSDAAAANDEEEDHDGASVASANSRASRSSARLKRRRDAMVASIAVPSIPENELEQREEVVGMEKMLLQEDHHNNNNNNNDNVSSPITEDHRSAKRQRTKSAKKAPAAPVATTTKRTDEGDKEDVNEDKKIMAVPEAMETKKDNGHHDERPAQDEPMEEDGMLPAAVENGHVSLPSVELAEAFWKHPPSCPVEEVPPAVAPTTVAVGSIYHAKAATQAAAPAEYPDSPDTTVPVQSKQRASEPRVTDRMEHQHQRRRESEPHQPRPSVPADTFEPPQLHEPPLPAPAQLEVPDQPHDADEHENGGDRQEPPAARQMVERLAECVVKLVGPAWVIVYENTTDVVVWTFHNVVQPLVRRRGVADDDDGEIVEEAVGVPVPDQLPTSSPWDRSWSWIILFLLVQVICFPFWTNPIMDQTVEFSDVLLQLYSRGQKGKGMPQQQLPTLSSSSDNREDTETEGRIREQISTLQQRQTELEALLGIRDMALAKIEEMTAALQQALSTKRDAFVQANQVVTASVSDLEELVVMDSESMLLSALFSSVLDQLKSSGSNDTTPLINTSRIVLWGVVANDIEMEPTCTSTQDDHNSVSPFLERQPFEDFVESLYSNASDSTATMQKEPEMIALARQWIRETLHSEAGLVVNEIGSAVRTDGEESRVQSDLARLFRLLEFRFEEEMADQTGKWDYASISNGAQVIASKTSPSLVNSLPILNRIWNLLGLRFYGHGPEAALTPTHPPYALGQCWSFLDQGKSTTEPLFGVLTVRLARPIFVESVLIEHPPEDVALDGVDSAVRVFQVQGFEEADASGPAWELGSFEYKLGLQAMSRQEFNILHEVNSEDIPIVRAVRIQIKSNWGGQYACLYRFRVHGYEEEEEF